MAFTVNAVWLAIFLDGKSAAKHLFNLVLELRLACFEHEVYLHTCHISGDHTFYSLSNDCSHSAGWTVGQEVIMMLEFLLDLILKILFHLMSLLSIGQTRIWRPGVKVGWGHNTHHCWSQRIGLWRDTSRLFIFAPPPVAVLVALKQLALSQHKRVANMTHVFICLHLLFQEEWQNDLKRKWMFGSF